MISGIIISPIDYCSNNRNNISDYAYALPVQGSKVSITTPYLYGGKEFYSLKGINLYDFSARTYAPDLGRFMQPDPKAGDYHWLSPYSYCGGDPINNIDKWGLETLALSNDDTTQTYVKNIPDDPNKLTVYTHGNEFSMRDDTDPNPNSKSGMEIKNGLDFINAVNQNITDFNNIRFEKGIEIRLMACKTGGDTSGGKKNIASQISSILKDAFVTAPVGRVKI